MNELIKTFISRYIKEIQEIPVYDKDFQNRKTIRSTVAWFLNEELEDLYIEAVDAVKYFLKESNVEWVMEKTGFEDDMELVICSRMFIGCASRILDDKARARKYLDTRLKGFTFDEEQLNIMRDLHIGAVDEFKTTIKDIVKRAKQLANIFPISEIK